MGLDIGPESIRIFIDALKDAKTVVWNGPMGVFEIADFEEGTKAVAINLAELKNAVTVVGGGDSAAAIAKFELEDRVSHVSTGGGASLEMLEGKEMPGVASISEKKNRRVIVAGNWKMYKTPGEAAVFTRKLLQALLEETHTVETVLCPPYVDLPVVMDVVTGTAIRVGAQNLYPLMEGAITGEISPQMLKDLNVAYVILGHSERRAIFKETNGFISEKLKSALKNGLLPIYCVGETLDERENGETFKILETQLKEGLLGLENTEISKVIIAYEPIWAIGTGKVATPIQAQEACKMIRNTIEELYNLEIAVKIPILYGGSIKPENFLSIMAREDVDGGLVGGASLKESFSELIKIAEIYA
jgi:triosephosphate isomerase